MFRCGGFKAIRKRRAHARNSAQRRRAWSVSAAEGFRGSSIKVCLRPGLVVPRFKIFSCEFEAKRWYKSTIRNAYSVGATTNHNKNHRGITRSYTSFSQAPDENGESRIYAVSIFVLPSKTGLSRAIRPVGSSSRMHCGRSTQAVTTSN